MSKFILSTMTNSVSYAYYNHAGDLPVIRAKVTIKGGTGLPSLSSGFGERGQDGEGAPMWTADGVITPITDEQYEHLKDHHLFKKHLAQGFVKVLASDIGHNHKAVQKAVSDMERRDGFALLSASDMKNHFNKAIKVSTSDIDADIQFDK